MNDLSVIADRLNINIEYVDENKNYPVFLGKIKDKRICIVSDKNTRVFAFDIAKKIEENGGVVFHANFDEEELIPDEHAYGEVEKVARSNNANYILAVGSGSINDICKYVSTKLDIPCGVLATACSMDGYVSKGSALIKNKFKVTESVHTPSDVLINPNILVTAPKIMTAAGFGDIMGKYTCLNDWRLSHIINGETINAEAFELMEKARDDCWNSFEDLLSYDKVAIEKLMNALVVAGLSMAICGNSRPASGGEHHMSHFLEMDFISRGEKVPPHGVKVAIGTLISIEIYNYIKEHRICFEHANEVYKLCEFLPKSDVLMQRLKQIGCPVRFSEIGVREETMIEMLNKAYTVRDRYTILTLVHDLGLTEELVPVIMEKFY